MRAGGSAGGSLGSGGSVDAFGRLRVSENHILLSSQLNYDLLPLVWDTELTGGGTVTHLPAKSAAELAVGVAAGDKVVRQTKRYWLYRAGQGQLVLSTFAEGDQVANVRKRVGYFDDNDGIFLEITDSDIALVLRSSTSGVPVDTRIPQANWGLDKMDGSGASGVNLDFTKTQILVIDLQWLGVGDVRIGFDVGGSITYAHIFRNANIQDLVYMRRGSLPCRYELENVGPSSGAVFHQICTGVMREGGSEEEGVLTSFVSDLQTPLGATDTAQSMVSLRLRSSHIRAFLRLLEVEVTNFSNAKMRWQAVLNPTLGGVLTWSDYGQAGQISIDQQTYTAGSGHVLRAGGVVSQGNSKLTLGAALGLQSILGVAANIAGTSDILSIIVESDQGVSQDLMVALSYHEMF